RGRGNGCGPRRAASALYGVVADGCLTARQSHAPPGRDRASGGGGTDEPCDRAAAIHLRTNSRGTRGADSEQIRVQLTRPDCRVGGRAGARQLMLTVDSLKGRSRREHDRVSESYISSVPRWQAARALLESHPGVAAYRVGRGDHVKGACTGNADLVVCPASLVPGYRRHHLILPRVFEQPATQRIGYGRRVGVGPAGRTEAAEYGSRDVDADRARSLPIGLVKVENHRPLVGQRIHAVYRLDE